MKLSERLSKLPPYLFAELDKRKSKIRAEGKDLIDLSIGDPDLEPPKALVDALKEELSRPAAHRYPEYSGSMEFRQAVAMWLAKRHNVKIDAGKEVLALIGSKEGLAHLLFAAINPEDVVLIPSPSYPMYSQVTLMAGGIPHRVRVLEANSYLPDLGTVPKDVLKKTKILFLNYPNNPTSAVATRDLFEEALNLARSYNFIVCHDAAYIEISTGAERPISILSLPEAKDVAVEFHSFSKTFCIAGWRIGFAAGNSDVIYALAKIKQNIDSGVFTALQSALTRKMDSLSDCIDGICSVYASRRKVFAEQLKNMGFGVFNSNATFYVWAKLPPNTYSTEFCSVLLEKAHVAATPGIGFGPEGEGFVRFSLTQPAKRLEEAVQRMAKL